MNTPNFRPVFAVLVLMLLAVPALSAQQKMVPLSSDAYDTVEQEFIRQGIAPPFNARPWSVEEFRFYYRQIGADIPAELMQEPDYHEPGLSVGFIPSVNLEAYAKTNPDGDEDYELPWLYGFGSRTPVVELGLDMFILESAYLGGDVELRQEYFATDKQGNPSNVNADFGFYDVQFPFTAYGTVGGPHWTLLAGRNDLALGPGRFEQLIVSDSPHWLDQLRLSAWWKNFKYSMALIYVQPYLTGSERQAAADYTTTDGDSSNIFPSKYFIFHRFDMKFFQRWNFAITEGLSWGGRPLDLRFLNPVGIMHNFYEWDYAASMLSLDTEVVPVKNLLLYGQFMFNSIQSSYEKQRYTDAAIPSAMGWMAGIQFEPRIEGAAEGLSVGFEYIHSDPWLYIREHSLNSFFWRRKALSNLEGGNPLISEPLGFSWGPDTVSYTFWTDIQGIAGVRNLDLDLRFSIVEDGEQDILTPYDTGEEAVTMRTPTGTPELWRILNIQPSYRLPERTWGRLSFWINTDILWLNNAFHDPGRREFDMQMTFGAGWSLQ
ncbi:hypothetical protein [Salinispira pacifica]|uniref:Capsule assembly Wzi family protein n=1 Tax=Salinispira pacifica TaxID=1307761 RepID=V5WLB6_9SPIO|nr:hypothetical protein [Salinispira pacifica]AHC16450.1 hypothetical protein L21SP2_3108 [Salinispira pacifica]